MFKSANKLYLISAGLIIFAVICLLLNTFSEIFNLIFAVFLIVAIILIMIVKIKNYVNFSKEMKEMKEANLIDMIMNSEGQYEADITTFAKKQQKNIKKAKRDKFLPILYCIMMLIIMGYALFAMLSNII